MFFIRDIPEQKYFADIKHVTATADSLDLRDYVTELAYSMLKSFTSQMCISIEDENILVYCSSGNFRVFKYSRIIDFGTFHEVYNSQISFFLSKSYYNDNFREILKFANLSSQNSRKLKPRQYYQIHSISVDIFVYKNVGEREDPNNYRGI